MSTHAPGGPATTPPDLPDAIAVTGLACRFPGAPDAGTFWANLVAGRESITFRTAEELAALGVPAERLADPRFVGAGGVLDGLAEFDAEYFGIPPRDAELMDPQHRLFLQCAVTALEDAGQSTDRVEGGVGVYASAGFNSYLTHQLLPRAAHLADRAEVQWLAAGDKDYLATQTSYRLGLTGPSLSVQSACSSALVAVHLAAEALLSGECDVALAGAVSAGVGQGLGYLHAEGGILSADGHCRPFDAAATGTVFGSGVGVVVLKRLADAVADGDTVRAVLLGSAVNNDGNRKVGFTAPSLDGQVRVIAAAQSVAGVAPGEVSCVEAHGTGTALGDRIELAALARVFGDAPDSRRVLGAVKSNVGHLDTCAGMAGLIKTVLALQHRTLLPTAHFESPSPELDPGLFRVLTEAEPWTGPDGARIAGVSSFGIGGTNAHLVLQDAPPLPAVSAAPVLTSGSAAPAAWELLPVTARTERALDRATERLGAALAAPAAPTAADAAFTLQTRRRHHPWRRTVLAGAGQEVRSRAVRAVGHGQDVAFLYPGQGAGRPGVAAEPYRTEPVFRAALDRCLEALRPWTAAPLRALLLDPAHPDLFDRTEVAQPALFAVEHALTEWWTALGVRPVALAGHSVGEFAAACAAGVFELPDAARLVAERGRLMGTMAPGAMLSVPLPEQELRAFLDGPDGLEPAAVNAPDRCVVAGAPDAVSRLAGRLAERGVTARPLAVRHAFHSRDAEPLLAEFARLVASVPAQAPALPVVSGLTGRELTAEEAVSPEYWARQLRHTVRFADALAALPGDGPLLELGPGRGLSGFAVRTLGTDRPALPSLEPTPAGAPRPPARLTALARLWERGAEVDWSAVGERAGRRHASLPGYPFEPVRHWFEPVEDALPAAPAVAALSAAPAPTAPDDVDSWLHVLSWTPALPPAGTGPVPSSVLLLADASGLAGPVAERLAAAGARVTLVHAPGGASTAADAPFALDPDDPAAFPALAAALAERGTPPDAVVSCLALDEPPLERATPGEAADGALRALTVPVQLARALGEAFPGRPLRMLLVTDAAHGVHGQPARTPQAAAGLGAVRVLPQEVPGLTAQTLDLDCPSREPADLALAAETVVAQLCSEHAPAPLTAVRGRAHLVPAPDRPVLTDPAAPRTAPPTGPWLVTGGLGGIGLAVAGRLAEDAGRTLVLLTRRAVPDGEGWHSLRPEGAAPAASCPPELAAALAGLTAHGARLCLAQADVTDEAALAATLDRVRAAYGPIAGVVHAAGVPGGGVTALRGPAEMARVLAPKVLGTVLLERLTARDRPLLVLCSSALAVTGAVGQADYTGANAFLDSFATGTRAAVSIGWDRWSQTGMAVRSGLRDWLDGGEALDHALFDARRTEPDGTVELRMRRSAQTRWPAEEHRIGDVPVLPGTALLELAVAGHRSVLGDGPVELDAVFTHPLRMPADQPPEVTLRLRPAPDGGHLWEVRSSAVPSRPHAQGRIAPHSGTAPERLDLDGLAERCAAVAPSAGPRPGGASGLRTGPRWESVTEVRESGDQGEAMLRLRLPEPFHGDLAAHPLHPALLDTATGAVTARTGSHLPVAYRRLVVLGPLGPDAVVRVLRRSGAAGAGGTLVVDVVVAGPDGTPGVLVEGFVLRPAPASGPDGAAAGADGAGRAVEPEQGGIPTREGLLALDRILANRHLPHVLVSPRAAGRTTPPTAAATATTTAAPPEAGPAGPEGLEERIAAVWSRLLGVPGIGPEDSLFELGGDSLLIVQITSELQRLGMAVSPGDLFAHPTVGQLAARLRADREPAAAPAPDTPAPPTAPAAPAPAPSQGTREAFSDADLSADDLARVFALFRSGEDTK
ncbi:SDR family NAD(P)-dependent oxidoreductase [Kitasatospora sp. NPDC048545]|uniref:type I polyketide synthase n=1 Tax=Kitasatospora sp. NPDC048545 TaxID=3157208 RepID=UPI0033D0098D